MRSTPFSSKSPNARADEEPDDELTPAEGIAEGAMPAKIAEWIRMGQYDIDRQFDRYLPSELRTVSRTFWTPVRVAARVAAWLDELSIRTLLDIGSGSGKFCVVAALAGSSTYLGIEQRPRLVAASRRLVERFGLGHRVCFLEGVFGEMDVPLASAYYLYNPFGENIYGPNDRLDSDVELTDERYHQDVAAVERLLTDAPIGTAIITYNGFGGVIPTEYEELRRDNEFPNLLRLMRRI